MTTVELSPDDKVIRQTLWEKRLEAKIAAAYASAFARMYSGGVRFMNFIAIVGTSSIGAVAINPSWGGLFVGLPTLALLGALAPMIATAFMDPRRPGQIDDIAVAWTVHVAAWEKLLRRWESDGSPTLQDVDDLVQRGTDIAAREAQLRLPDMVWLLRRCERRVFDAEGISRTAR